MRDDQAITALREELLKLCNKPPESVINGSVQATRSWMSKRQAAVKLVTKQGVTAGELLSAISSMKG